MAEIQKPRVTLLDIAADADVSRATVSLVIRNVPTVAEETRKRVLRSIHKLGYVYHRGAASLRRQQSHAVGLIVSDITQPFFAEVLIAIDERLAAAGIVTLLGNSSESRAKEERLIRTMREFPTDGMLICPSHDGESPKNSRILSSSIPTVAFARPVPGLDYAGINNAHGTELAVKHLYGLGHRRIAFIAGNPEVSSGRDRLDGYRQTVTQLGLEFDPLLVVPCNPSRRGGYDSILLLSQLDRPPTAACCFNDAVALGAIEALQHLGKKPGADFGIVGFNNTPEAAQNVLTLTTVDTAPRQLGETAAELLLKRIEKPDAPIQTVILQPRLMVRESCGASSYQNKTFPIARGYAESGPE
ncbi:MAG TPA: LacI family DNA-binding transcriptional regulator [Chthoniobacterales bacterium]